MHLCRTATVTAAAATTTTVYLFTSLCNRKVINYKVKMNVLTRGGGEGNRPSLICNYVIF
jgi:hypothetical protein